MDKDFLCDRDEQDDLGHIATRWQRNYRSRVVLCERGDLCVLLDSTGSKRYLWRDSPCIKGVNQWIHMGISPDAVVPYLGALPSILTFGVEIHVDNHFESEIIMVMYPCDNRAFRMTHLC